MKHTCFVCDSSFSESDFDWIDDEFNDDNPTCAECQKRQRISNHFCEFCDLAAEYETESFYLCEHHFEDYVDGYNYQ